MSVAFRIRTSAGQELSFASHVMFEDAVRAGVLSLDDLVYDVETRSWAPARTHPIVLNIQYEKEGEAEATAAKASDDTVSDDLDAEPSAEDALALSLASEAGPVEADLDDSDADAVALAGKDSLAPAVADGNSEAPPPHSEDASGDFGLSLAPEAEVSQEEAATAFVDKMAFERAMDLDLTPSDGGGIGVIMEGRNALADMIGPADGIEAEPELAPRLEPPRPRRTERSWLRFEPAKPKSAGGGAGRRLVLGVVVIAVVGGGAYFGLHMLENEYSEAVSAPTTPVVPIEVEDTPPPPVADPIIASTESAVRERAQERFLSVTQDALRDLEPIPDVWMTAEYLALPSANAGVLDIWQRYLTVVRELRSGEAERYSISYELALDDAAIAGDARRDRVSVAVSDFGSEGDLRSGHYDRVEGLATAAIQSHTALLDTEGLIQIDPAGVGNPANGVGVGVVGRDADSQLLLDQVISLISATLEAEGSGPGTGRDVREWVWDGFLDAVTR